jgi:membrane fusion protein
MATGRPNNHLPIYMLGAILLAAIAFLCAFDYKRKVRLDGLVLSSTGISRIYAPGTGFIALNDVREGQTVNSGKVLGHLRSIKDVYEAASMATADQVVAEKEAILRRDIQRGTLQHESKMRSARAAREEAQGQLVALQHQEEIARTQLTTAERVYQRYTELHREGFISMIQLEEKLAAVTEAKFKLQTLKAQRTSAEKNVVDTDENLRGMEILRTAQNDDLAMRSRELARERSLRTSDRGLNVVAPISGVLSAIAVRNGQYVTDGNPILAIIPSNDILTVALFAPSEKAGLLRPGQRVVLRITAFPYEKFGFVNAVVREVATIPQAAGDAAFEHAGTPSQTPVYRVLVDANLEAFASKNKQIVLRPGLSLEGDIIVEKRRLIEWAFSVLFRLVERA